MSQGRSVWGTVWKNFLNSLRILPQKGRLVGEDNLGNKYYQVLEGHRTSKKHPIRWFVPQEKEDWQQDLPAEWEAWLRNRRKDPPTEEEVMKNAAIAQMKKERGDEIMQKSKDASQSERESLSIHKGFPNIKGLERSPGFTDKKS